MLRLSEIMTRDVVTVSPDLTLRDASELLSGRHVTGAPVVEGNKVVGVISLTDLATFGATVAGVPTDQSPSMETTDGEDEMGAAGGWVDGDDTPAAFFVDLWADAGADVAERFDETRGPEWNVLEEHTVGEIMNRTLCSLPPDARVDQAADLMRTAGVHRVLVMEGEELVGLVTTRDITDAVAGHKLTARTYVFERGPRQAAHGTR